MEGEKDTTISKITCASGDENYVGGDISGEEAPIDLSLSLLFRPSRESLCNTEETISRKRKSRDDPYTFVHKDLGITLPLLATHGDHNRVGAPPEEFTALSLWQPLRRNEALAHRPIQETVMSTAVTLPVGEETKTRSCAGESHVADTSDEVDLKLSLSSLAYDDKSILDAAGAPVPVEEFPGFPHPFQLNETFAQYWRTQETASIPVAPRALYVHATTPSPAVRSAPLAVQSVSAGRLRPEPTPKGEKKYDNLKHPPFPWATDRRATVHSLRHILSQGMTSISGELECTECKARSSIFCDLRSKFAEVRRFIAERSEYMHDRAPEEWMKPVQRDCRSCKKSHVVTPVISPKKRAINWLFLFLMQGIGFCGLRHLKYFCKHTKNHRTGAKDRLVYLTYMDLYQQLSRPS